MTKLSVNINKIATLRNARGGKIPDVVKAAVDCQRYGADGITVHPRPDERHIKIQDVFDISPIIETEFNIEGYPNKNFIDLVLKVKPQQVTLVPDSPEAITSNAGWNTVEHFSFLKDIVHELKKRGIRTSIFLGTEEKMIEQAKKLGTDRIEFYTEPFADLFPTDPERAIEPFLKAAVYARKNELDMNAGHDLNLQNLNYLIRSIPDIAEVSVGHALIADALYLGLENSIRLYKRALQ